MGGNQILSAADEVQHVSWFHKIFLNRWYWIGFSLFICAIIIPITVYLLCFNNFDESADTCSIDLSYRVRCGAENVESVDCEKLGCCFINNLCYHRYPPRYGYTATKNNPNVYHSKQKSTPLGNEAHEEIVIRKRILSDNRIDLFMYDNARENIEELPTKSSSNFNCTVYSNATIVIVHKRTNEVILSTNYGPLIASDGFWEITVSLQTKYLFGLGQHNLLKGRKTYIFYNNPKNFNNFPIVLAYKNRQYYGLFLENNGTIEMEMLDSKLLVFRSRTKMPVGFHLSFVVAGSFLEIMDIFRNYGKDASKWMQMPYWHLGVHVCRETDSTTTDLTDILEEAKEFYQNATDANFPYESDCLDGNLFSFAMNTTASENQQIESFLKQAKKEQDKKFFMLFSSLLANTSTSVYKDALKSKILYRDSSACDNILMGTYRNRTVTYPDYGHKNANEWFNEYIETVPGFRFIDAVILRDDWPLLENYTVNLTTEDFVYLNKDFNNTLQSLIPWNSQTECTNDTSNVHFESHNKYGLNFARHFEDYFNSQKIGEQPPIFTTSAYYNHLNEHSPIGIFNQNVTLSWLNLQTVLSQSLFYSTLVEPVRFIAPVCGSTPQLDTRHEELCVRWYLTAATLPFFHIMNITPFKFPSQYYEEKIVEIIQKRYALLPYFYTVINYNDVGHETKIWPLIRPLYYHFPLDNVTYDLNSQYMIGSNLMVAQILLPKVTEMSIYLPMKNMSDNYETVWYEFWNGKRYNLGTMLRGGNETMDSTGKMIKITPLVKDWLMYMMGGSVIVVHDFQDMTAGNAAQMRLKPLVIMVGLECKKDGSKVGENAKSNCRAEGVHIVTDTMSQPQEILKFVSNENYLRINHIKSAAQWLCKDNVKKSASIMKKIIIYGRKDKSMEIQLNKDLCDNKNDDYYDIYYNETKL